MKLTIEKITFSQNQKKTRIINQKKKIEEQSAINFQMIFENLPKLSDSTMNSSIHIAWS